LQHNKSAKFIVTESRKNSKWTVLRSNLETSVYALSSSHKSEIPTRILWPYQSDNTAETNVSDGHLTFKF